MQVHGFQAGIGHDDAQLARAQPAAHPFHPLGRLGDRELRRNP
jgi:hypothetical protein